MRLWLVPVVLGACLILAGLGLRALSPTSGSPAPDQPVLAAPMAGDRALYEGYEFRTEGGQQVEADLYGLAANWATRWNATQVLLPSGDHVTMPSIEISYPTVIENVTRSGADPTEVLLGTSPLHGLRAIQAPQTSTVASTMDIAYHYSAVPGKPAVASFVWVTDGNDFGLLKDEHLVWRSLHLLDKTCWGDAAGLIARLNSTTASDRIQGCMDDAELANATVSAAWEEHASWGLTWTLRFAYEGLDYADLPYHGETVLRTSPAISLILEESGTYEYWDDGVPVHAESGARLVGWQAGDVPLALGPVEVPAPLSVPLVRWSAEGPASGDLEVFPLQEAKDAAATTVEGSEYFRDHSDAWIQYASFAREPPVVARMSPVVNQAPCQDPADPVANAPFPAAVHEDEWLVQWTDTDQDLLAWVSAPQVARNNPLGIRLPVTRTMAISADDSSGRNATRASQGPELQAVMDALPLVDARGGRGVPFLATAGPYSLVPISEALVAPVMSAVVGRTDCAYDAGSQRMVFQEIGLVFEDGSATSAYAVSESGIYDHDGGPLGLSGRPPVTAPPSQMRALPVLPLEIAGIFLVAGGAAAPPALRTLPGLYTRLTSREILNNPSRARVLEAVRARPGTSALELAPSLGIHQSSVKHHLRMLDKLGFVALTRTGRGLVAHPIGDPASLTARVMSRAHAPELVAAIRARPGRSVSELAAELGLRKSRVSVLVSELEEAAVVSRRRGGREVRLFAAASAPRERAP